jgi:hypothetical protein
MSSRVRDNERHLLFPRVLTLGSKQIQVRNRVQDNIEVKGLCIKLEIEI